MRKLLLSAIATLLTISSNAQISKTNGMVNIDVVPSSGYSINKAPARAELANNQRQYGPYSGNECDNYIGTAQYIGENKIGVFLSADELAPYYGTKVAGVRFNLGQGCTATGAFVIDASGTKYNNLATANQNVTSAETGANTGTWQTIMFDEANQFELSANYADLLIGYSYIQSSSNYPIGIYSGRPDSQLNLYINYTDGWGWYGLPNSYGTPCIQLILQDDNFPTMGATPLDLGKFGIGLGHTKNIDIDIFNLGTEAISNIDYTITDNGSTSEEKHIELGQSYATNSIATISIPFVAAEAIGENSVDVTITKVNGKTNEAANKTVNGTKVTVEKEFQKISVVEECTGTGCGYCPRGHVGIHKAKEKYGDKVICLAAHMYNQGDPMYINKYYYSSSDMNGAPSCIINRNSGVVDPYYEMPTKLTKTYKTIPMAGITVSGTYNSDSTLVNATASAETLVDGSYDVAYVLVADSVGNSRSSLWRQLNYYNTNSKSELPTDLQEFVGKGSSFAMDFNDVIIDHSYTGKTNNATFGDIVKGATTTGSYTLSMPTKTTLKNAIKKNYIYVVAILTDKTTGEIVNAAKAKVVAGTTDIKNIDNAKSANIVARYGIDGTKLEAPAKGINIIKLADGTTRKVVVK